MIAAQTRAELRLALRRGESVLVTLIMPPVLLVFFGLVDLMPVPPDRRVDYLVPGILALAIMSTAMVSAGIATAFERYYKVLKRLGASPLPRAGLLAAKICRVLVIEVGADGADRGRGRRWCSAGGRRRQPIVALVVLMLGTARVRRPGAADGRHAACGGDAGGGERPVSAVLAARRDRLPDLAPGAVAGRTGRAAAGHRAGRDAARGRWAAGEPSLAR